jgi:hypothetical protein
MLFGKRIEEGQELAFMGLATSRSQQVTAKVMNRCEVRV